MRPLIHALDPDRPFYALQARGLDGVSEPLRSIEAMASRYLEETTRICADGPRLLAGYSMGGVVAYEMAQQLAARGRRLDALVLIDTGAPLALPWKDRLTYTYLYSRLAMRRLGRGARRRRRARYARSVSSLMRASFRAGQRYRAKPFRGNVHLISSTGGEMAPGTDEQERRLVRRIDRRLVQRRGLWDRLLGDGITTHEIDGHHLDLFRRPALDLLATELQRILDAATAPQPRAVDDRTSAAAVIP
jgi:thioesterase domain-containing protein